METACERPVRGLDVKSFPAFCRARALKCTAQRLAVFASVRAATHHPSVDETWRDVQRTIPTITRESVYRILNELKDLGLIGRLDAFSSAHYDTNLKPHAHFVCETCGTIIDYPLPDDIPLPEGLPKIQNHLELRVTGTCEDCRLKNRRSRRRTAATR